MSEETPEYGMRSGEVSKEESEALMEARMKKAAEERANEERAKATKQAQAYLERIGWREAKRSNIAGWLAEFAIEYKNDEIKDIQDLHDKHAYFQGDNWIVLKRMFSSLK